jgi:hypothetical protein
MHNASRNNYHASSSYHHLSSSQAPQHRSSRFPQNAPNRGNFAQGGDSVNNWSRVRDNQQQVPEQQVLFRESERVQWDNNARGRWNRGGNFQRASQSQAQSYQTDSNSLEAAEPEIDEWGREIRGGRQSPTYDERLGERVRESALNREIHVYVGFNLSMRSLMSNYNKRIQRGQEAEKIWVYRTPE